MQMCLDKGIIVSLLEPKQVPVSQVFSLSKYLLIIFCLFLCGVSHACSCPWFCADSRHKQAHSFLPSAGTVSEGYTELLSQYSYSSVEADKNRVT